MIIFEIIEKLNMILSDEKSRLSDCMSHSPAYECNVRIDRIKRLEHALYNLITAYSGISISTEIDYKACTTTITDNSTGEIVVVPFIVRVKTR